MPELDGLEATRRILAANDTARILILTTFGLDEYVYEALRDGASGFVLKDDPPEQLISAVRAVAGGNALLSPAITKHVIQQFAKIPRPVPPQRAQRPHRTRARHPPAHRHRPVQRRDRTPALHQQDHRQDTRHAHPPEAGPPRPRPSGRARIPDRPHRGRPRPARPLTRAYKSPVVVSQTPALARLAALAGAPPENSASGSPAKAARRHHHHPPPRHSPPSSADTATWSAWHRLTRPYRSDLRHQPCLPPNR